MAYRIGDYQLDPLRRELRCGQMLRRLEPQVFDTLLFLVENRARVVSKDDLVAAVWNGRFVSDATVESRIKAARRAVGDDGRSQKIIRTIPRRGFRFVAEVEGVDGNAGTPAFVLPDKPSIAVLPFQNMSGDAEQEYFADGITEDIITALSRIPSLFVIARNSSFAYKGKAIDIRQIGRELGVRYVLEGSVRKAGQRLRITGQLVDAETGSHLWVDRFDSVLEDVFDVQDRVTMAVAGAIEPSVTQAEIRRANRKPTENLQAYDWLLRGLGERQLYSRDSFDRAIGTMRHAIELDPRYAQAYAYLAHWIMVRKVYGRMDDDAVETAEAVRFAHLAVQLAPNDSLVLTFAAVALGNLNRDLANALPWLDRAIALNPNSAHAFGLGAIVRTIAGDYATAIDHADRAMRLSPFDPASFAFSMARGISHLLQRQLPEAVAWLRKAAHQNPRHVPTLLYLGSALAHAGQMEEARVAIRRLLELHPMSTVSWQRQRRPVHEDDIEYLLEGARLAGLPE